MIKYIFKRLLWMIPVVLGVAILIFTIMYFVPGDPAVIILGSNATAAQVAELKEKLGLNDPYYIRLLHYLRDVFLHLDFGTSYATKLPVMQEILSRFPRTLIISFVCMILSIVVGVPLGVYAAVKQDKLGDRISMFVALLGVSMPSFWLALLLVLLFSLKLRWLPATGIGGIQYYILPCLANSFGGIAQMARQSRSSMLENIRADCVTTARSKGISKNAVITKHALTNALIPIITVAAMNFGSLLGTTLIIEQVFSIPGLGSYMIGAVNSRDYPVVQGCVIFLAIAFSFIMLIMDLAYSYVDPRIKAQYEKVSRRKKHV